MIGRFGALLASSLACATALAQSVTATLTLSVTDPAPLTAGSGVLAVDTVTNRIFAAGAGPNVARIDGATNTISIVPTSYQVYSLLAYAGKVYAGTALASDGRIVVINGQSWTVLNSGVAFVGTPGPMAESSEFAAMRQDGQTVTWYTVNNSGPSYLSFFHDTDFGAGASLKGMAMRIGSVVAIDGPNSKVWMFNSISSPSFLSVADFPVAIAANVTTNKFYAVSAVGTQVGTLTVISGVDNSLTPIAVGKAPRALAINETTNKIYVANAASTDITVVNGADNTTQTITLAGAPQAIAVNPATNVVYAIDDAATLVVIDGSSNTVLPSVPLGGNGTSLAVNPATNRVYVGRGANTLLVISGTPTTTTLASSLNPAAYPVPVTLTATVTGSTPPTGFVTFSEGVHVLCSAVPLAGGAATCAVPTANRQIGAHAYTASYAGDAGHDVSMATLQQAVLTPAKMDFSGDGRSDLLYRNSSTGQVYRMLMNGFAITNGAFAYAEPNTAWKIVGDGDFNGDGVSDLVWRNESTGQVYLLTMGLNGLPLGGGFVYTEPDTAWRIVGTGGLDEGRNDIVWWNSSTGQVYGLIMDGTTITGQGFIATQPDTAWKIVGTGSFGLLWRNDVTGQVSVMKVFSNWNYYSNPPAIIGFSQYSVPFYTEPNLAWKIVATADFNGDGESDILWRNDVTGQVYMMLMLGWTIQSQGMVYQEPNLDWKIVAAGDYNGDGKADILWRNDTTGQVYMMLMNGLVRSSESMVYVEPNTAWKIVGPLEYGQ
jgi:DNA-binding beta-propeller fold protein YncE